jgi:hypothetical protein
VHANESAFLEEYTAEDTRTKQEIHAYLPPPVLEVKLMMARNKSGGQAYESKWWGKGLS